ncbi:MAG: peptidoglycan DD-metalloendopeptidase family protein [Dehalococcoidales bacterium]|nr:peptidoglycan DD-metalloendopeptidase family protein [Dehalococcoidales bacterium]
MVKAGLVLCLAIAVILSGCTSPARPGTNPTEDNQTSLSPASPSATPATTPIVTPPNTSGTSQSTTASGDDKKTGTDVDYSKLDSYGETVTNAIIASIGVKRYQLIRDGIAKPTGQEAEIIASCIGKYASIPKSTPTTSPITTQPQPENPRGLMYEIYPVTDAAPVLELYWGPPDLSMDNIARFTPYGIWEGPYEPAYEMQFYTFSSHDPVYAPCAGTVVNIFGGLDPNTGNEAGGVTIRYGRNYSVTLQHVVEIPLNIKVGSKIEAKTLVGYTQGQMNVGWWEIEVAARVGNVIRTKPPYDFFSPGSKKRLDSILAAAIKKESSPYTSWTVTETNMPSIPAEGKGSWIQDLGGKKEWWASGERMGIQGDPDSLADFFKANNLEALIPHMVGGAGQPGTPKPEEKAENTNLVIYLPFSTADNLYEMMPMGETINHPKPENPFGHPGIDFMWNKSVDIIACVDGTVTQVEKSGSHDKWDVFVKTGSYKIGYTTLEKVDDKIKVGAQVIAGQKIGEPGNFGHYMIHWELDKLESGQRVCPMAYLDETARQRILDIWAKTNWPEMKKQFPHICNGDYRCDFCRTHGY